MNWPRCSESPNPALPSTCGSYARFSWCECGKREAGKQRYYGLDARGLRPNGESVDDPDAFESVLTFENHGELTRIVMRTVFPTTELRDQAVEEFRANEGGEQTLERLAEYLQSIDHEEVRR